MTHRLWLLGVVAIASWGVGCATVKTGPGAPQSSGSGLASTGPFVEPATGAAMLFVKGGCFKMGTGAEIAGPEERPAHEVCVGDFYVGKFEVTRAQWKKVMGSAPPPQGECDDECPVTFVSWDDARVFLEKLNRMSAAGGTFRLPTEAEWEYAARSGGKDEKYSGANGDEIELVGIHYWSSAPPQRGGTLKANGLGIHDMTGNVWEWTSDWYSADTYSTSPRDDPKGPAAGDRKVLRGGAFDAAPFDCRTTFRNYVRPDYRGADKGLRLVMTPAGTR